MSQSTDAIVAFGVDLGEGIPHWLNKFVNLDEENSDSEPVIVSLKKVGLTLCFHCSDSCTMYVLALKGTEQTAWRGSPKPLVLPMITAEQMKAWEPLQKHFRGSVKKPQWLLFSWVG